VVVFSVVEAKQGSRRTHDVYDPHKFTCLCDDEDMNFLAIILWFAYMRVAGLEDFFRRGRVRACIFR